MIKSNAPLKCLPLILMFILPLTTLAQWSYHSTLVASDRNDREIFGKSLAVNDSVILVGAERDSEDASGNNFIDEAGSVYCFERNGSREWSQTQKITANSRSNHALFGSAISIDGNYAIVGAPQHDYDRFGVHEIRRAGAAYIFKCSNDGSWQQQTQLAQSDTFENSYFGKQVIILGNYALVSAGLESQRPNDSIKNSGALYFFKKNQNEEWHQIQRIEAFDRKESDNFGYKIAFNGSMLFVSSYDIVGIPNIQPLNASGAVYIYKLNTNDSFSFIQKLRPQKRNSSQNFGCSLDLNGNELAIGATLDSFDLNGNKSDLSTGAVYYYELIDENAILKQKLRASDTYNYNTFGFSLCINDSKLLVGAISDNTDAFSKNNLDNSGSLYLFEKDINGYWKQTSKLVHPNRARNDFFGYAVGLNKNFVIATSIYDDEDANNENPLENSGSLVAFSDGFVNIHEITKNTITIYPNPCYETVTIENQIGTELYLYHSNGNLIKRVDINSNNYLLYLSETSGFYYLKIIDNQGNHWFQKLVKH